MQSAQAQSLEPGPLEGEYIPKNPYSNSTDLSKVIKEAVPPGETILTYPLMGKVDVGEI